MLRAGKDLKDHAVPPPYYGQRHLLLGQVCQGFIQPGLEHYQGWGVSNISQQPVFHHSHSQEFFPRIQLKFPLFQFVSIPTCPDATVPTSGDEESFSGLPVHPFYSYVKGVGQKEKHSLTNFI